jgi:hypothetical protein
MNTSSICGEGGSGFVRCLDDDGRGVGVDGRRSSSLI